MIPLILSLSSPITLLFYLFIIFFVLEVHIMCNIRIFIIILFYFNIKYIKIL